MHELIQTIDDKTISFMALGDNQTKSKDEYFLQSGDKIRFFLEEKAKSYFVDGSLSLPLEKAINKVGHALYDLDNVYKSFTAQRKIVDLCSTLGYVDPLVVQSMYIFKQPNIGAAVPPHQDNTFLHCAPKGILGFWLALDDAQVENGCLWGIPGSHNVPTKNRFKLNEKRDGVYFDKPNSSIDWPDHSHFVPLNVEAGGLVVIHGNVIHKSEENTSDKPRHAFTLHFMESTDVWDRDNWLQRESFPRLLEGLEN